MQKENHDIQLDDETLSMLKHTFEEASRSRYRSLWKYLDHCFEQSVLKPFLLNVEHDFRAAEDFCIYKGIHESEIPELYREMFSVKVSIFGQAKLPYYISDEWMSLRCDLSSSIDNINDNTLVEFREYLQSRSEHGIAFADLNRYMTTMK